MFDLPLLIALGQAIAISTHARVPSFNPLVPHKSYTTQVAPNIKSRIHTMTQNAQPLDATKIFVQTQLGFQPTDYIVKDLSVSDNTGVTHIYLRQKVHGREVFNADINVNISPGGEVLSYGDSFHRDYAKSFVETEFPREPQPATRSMESFLEYLKILLVMNRFWRNHVILMAAKD